MNVLTEKKNSVQGFLSLFGSMLLYAFSGVVVVGLSTVFDNVGQVTFRALAALALTVVWLLVVGFRYKLKHYKEYDMRWLAVDIVCRPIFNISFVYATLEIGPTVALFYLFSSKVIFGGIIKSIFGSKNKEWFDYLSYLMVVTGLLVFTFPISAFSIGIVIAMIAGLFEAVKSEAMGMLLVKGEDKPVVALYEFASLAVITAVIVLLTNQRFITSVITMDAWLVLGMSAVVAVGSLFLELTGFAKFDADLGNAVLASEMGFAGLINFVILGTLMSFSQIIGAAILVVSLAFVALASYLRNKNKEFEKRRRKEILMEG
ncbi:hypothetical protein A2572_02315 [Candidatus Collierbacteria bacterium RIFOXYD1_FULL_40_9]|uniref:EamA domain-containing protein n=1 Tax=Candidatus Collierbacteria bacterium RIFOXYD1_FULL_40_9 TaxID=1817731 RepID=A0A1F5FP47_9BACT|nr:MAG: hypothetical protein A2572_02315 [Candidatus Collierbacteria bacterium RIFOXYD1_FULL_40_9]